MYAGIPIGDREGEIADELQAGMDCLRLLHEHPQNTELCCEREEELLLLDGLQKQPVPIPCQWVVEAARDACRHDLLAKQFAMGPKAREVVVLVLTEGLGLTPQDCQEEDTPENMALLRLDLFRLTVQERAFYNGTKAFETLLHYWEACDNGRFNVEVLRLVFRGLRAIVNQYWMQEILQHKVLERLVEKVNDTSSDIRMLPDVFFLIGTLASIPQLKDALGELGAVEASQKFVNRERPNLNRGVEERDVAPAVTNALLSLGTLCAFHVGNTKRFCDMKGLEASVEIMSESMTDRTEYDVANASAVVLCNVSFRRDDMKEEYGRLKAPEAIMETVRKYNGAQSPDAYRCLSSMFKAIGNLSLYTTNIPMFLDGGIAKMLEQFFKQSHHMPDTLIETASRCLTNLVMENTTDFMEQFGVVVEPLINTLNERSQNTASEMFGYALQALAALSRHQRNAQDIIRLKGVQMVTTVAKCDASRTVHIPAIGIIATIANQEGLNHPLIDQGALDLIIMTLQEECNCDEVSPDLALSTLVCLRRLLKDQAAGRTFIERNGLSVVIAVLLKGTSLQSVQIEGFRAIFALLHLFPPPVPEDVDEPGWDDEPVPDEGFSPLVYQIQRPPGPRSWESCNMSTDQIIGIITAACNALSDDTAHKHIKLQRILLAILAYFAAEKPRNTMEAFFTGNYFNNVIPLMELYRDNGSMVSMIAETTANVAVVSEQDTFDALRNNESFIKACHQVEKALQRPWKHVKKDFRLIADFLACKYHCGRVCTRSITFFADDGTQKDFLRLADWNFDIDRSQWAMDKYPNGVQDLPADIKEGLRQGGLTQRITVETPTGEPMLWKASQDLL